MKHLITFSSLSVSSTLVFAHGKHESTQSDVLHGLLHAASSFEGLVSIFALSVAVYFIVKK
jgi:hypothetical protein